MDQVAIAAIPQTLNGRGSGLGLGKSWNPIDLGLKSNEFAEQVLFMNRSSSH